MCSICEKTLKDFGVEHTPSACPLRNSRYCSYCAKYGHLTKICPAKPEFREPTYLEKLIPPSELKEYNITSKTPIKYKVEPQQLLEIKDDNKVILAYLLERFVKIQYSPRHTLEEYAQLNNKRLIYR